LFVCLFSFGFFANLLNISINTQAVAVEGLYRKKIMASFHGIWSLAGFVGAALGTWMIGRNIAPFQHYIIKMRQQERSVRFSRCLINRC
jgi:hypothetical protein